MSLPNLLRVLNSCDGSKKTAAYSPNTDPMPGMIIFFDWDGDRSADHMGIVDGAGDGDVFVIEGNSGDKCVRNSYGTGSSEILAYGAI